MKCRVIKMVVNVSKSDVLNNYLDFFSNNVLHFPVSHRYISDPSLWQDNRNPDPSEITSLPFFSTDRCEALKNYILS